MKNRSSRLVAVSVVSLLLVFAYGAVTYAAVGRARAARRAPRLSQVTALMAGDWPHHIVARYVLLRPGTAGYSEVILPWILRNDNGLTDRPWNRYLVEHFVENSGVDFAEFARGYPLTPSDAFLDRLVPGMQKGQGAVIAIMSRSPNGRDMMRLWIDERLRVAADPAVFKALLPLAVAVGPDSVKALTTRLMPPAPLMAEAINAIDGMLLTSDQWTTLFELVASAVSDKRLRLESVNVQIAAMLAQPATSDQAAKLILGHLSLLKQEPLLLIGAGGCDVNDPYASCMAMPAVSMALRDQLLAALFERFRAAPQEASDLFHVVAHTSPATAATLVAQACQEPDSVVRKSIVVLAARHEVPVACLDTAFTGEARRLALFHLYEQYVTNSEAAKEYERLAGHAFFGVGKRWPLHYGAAPTAQDAEHWELFIAKYPWFPAVDDAYLRLAYSHLLAGRHADAVRTVARYRALTLLDDDSTPFINLLDTVARSELGEPTDDRIEDLRQALRDRAWFWNEESLAIDDAAEAVDWYIRNDVGVGPAADLMEIRRDVENARAACVERPEECHVPESVGRLPTDVQVPERLRPSYAAVFGR